MNDDIKTTLCVCAVIAVAVGSVLALITVISNANWRYDQAMIDKGYVKVPQTFEHWEKAK